ncbi:helix-turn-helix domain-containing protein [Allobranchiibius sp. GilTou38]|uniref:winged helix-turn-helix domain-containing protein n=1 Tax=Allobranchiibius sp. GilTou38 TaxID=2815210 RepID=UPI001AA1C407|nr:helix-turn-helix domain-containing protein [Allobranchiibius sp. GilTou38]MBO1765224.1 helix-turn-helix transcriptional regulator [Allobranchiibius sp. GilTou38]
MVSKRPASTLVEDPRTLRAIAHPVRNRILTELAATGPARAADLAQDLGIPANQTSFHLRQLAKYGLVEEAPEAARDRRDRVWKVVAEGGYLVNLRALEAAPETRAASLVWRSHFERWAHAVISAAMRRTSVDDGAVVTISDTALRLTDEEARAMVQEVNDVVSTWAARTRGRDPQRRTYLLMYAAQPYPDLEIARDEHGADDGDANDSLGS